MVEETKRISKKTKLYQEIEKKYSEEQLKYARERKAKAESQLELYEFGSQFYDEARTRRNLWTGYVGAYESVLQIDPEATV